MPYAQPPQQPSPYEYARTQALYSTYKIGVDGRPSKSSPDSRGFWVLLLMSDGGVHRLVEFGTDTTEVSTEDEEIVVGLVHAHYGVELKKYNNGGEA